MIDRDTIEHLALENGFKLKEQPDGAMALNPYVFDFAQAVAQKAVEAEREACAEQMEKQHAWITNIAASKLIRNRGIGGGE